MPGDRPLNRRELLGRAGALWLAPGVLGSWPGLGAGAARELVVPRDPLRKCMSMGGYGPLVVPDGHPNDYRLHGNREYLRDLSGTRWVKLWVSWAHLQEELQPASRAESWAHLNGAPGGERALERLDRQVQAVNEDARRVPGGMGVIVTLYQEFPTWSSAPASDDPARAGKPLNAKLPLDLSEGGPWAWWLGHLCARYRAGAPANPAGPADGPQGPSFGNPLGAVVDLIEICNEPNFLLWPQAAIHQPVAQMVRTAAAVSATLGGPGLLAPATSDFPDNPSEGPGATDWLVFTQRVLDSLADLRPGVPVSWSHHNYLDVKDEVNGPASRARRVADLLHGRAWPGARAKVWLTEGGVNMFPDQGDPEARLEQARKIEQSFGAMAGEPDIFMWTQHEINDVTTNDFKSGLRDEFLPSRGPGTPRPSLYAWAGLPGSRGR